MNSITIRTRNAIRNVRIPHYKNLRVESVDGKTQFVECNPVQPSLASEFSVSINAILKRMSSSLGSRLNVDAVDLPETLQVFETNLDE